MFSVFPTWRIFFFFFFQAEDGIRDTSVTGVKTCALPISSKAPRGLRMRSGPEAGHEDRRRSVCALELGDDAGVVPGARAWVAAEPRKLRPGHVGIEGERDAAAVPWSVVDH